MKPLVSILVLLLATPDAMGRPASRGQDPWSGGVPSGQPHPAVVRVMVPDGTGFSFGSGALVAAVGDRGLVVTNWHVIREAAGQIVVAFPDGFRSAATVLGTDRDWDLAALAIRRPGVAPIRLATQAPRPGELLTIAGYGTGWYRETTGRCTQYVSPGRNQPFEMVELSAGAREGDSGGPILNSRGELAGVLFGAAWGETTGSYCGRVRWFLDSVASDFRGSAPGPAMIAQRPDGGGSRTAGQPRPNRPVAGQRPPPVRIAVAQKPSSGEPGLAQSREVPAARANGQVLPTPLPTVSIPAGRTPESPPSQPVDVASGAGGVDSGSNWGPREPNAASGSRTTVPLRWEDVAGTTLGEQIKTILAGVGVLAIFLHGLRLLSRAQRS